MGTLFEEWITELKAVEQARRGCAVRGNVLHLREARSGGREGNAERLTAENAEANIVIASALDRFDGNRQQVLHQPDLFLQERSAT